VRQRSTFLILIAIGLVMVAMLVMLPVLYLNADKLPVLDAKGIVGWEERQLLVQAMWLMLIVVVPVYLIMLVFIWRYRAGNEKAKYTPNWGDSWIAEVVWWGLPCAIVVILSVMTWRSSHRLDPYRPLAQGKAMTVQVIALQWKWLFLYPELGIATLNTMPIPEGIPIHFEITAQAPMNSFWIPQLGGQIFAMPGMRTQLYLIAEQAGTYRGLSANLSGDGFANMYFSVPTWPRAKFDAWAAQVKKGSKQLTRAVYDQLALPSVGYETGEYVLSADGLFDEVVMAPMMAPSP
jgi:cytochrome o ubiquinol oxidase subunit II